MVVTSSTSPQTTTEAPTSYTSTVRTIKALSTKHQRTVTSDQTTERELTTVVKTANTAANSRTKEVRTSQSTESFTKHQSSFSFISAKSFKSTHNINSITTDGKRSSTSSFHTPVETSRPKQDITSAPTHTPISSEAVITNGQNTPGTSTKVNLSAPRQKVVTDKVSR